MLVSSNLTALEKLITSNAILNIDYLQSNQTEGQQPTDHDFELSVFYLKQYFFKARLIELRVTHTFEVDVSGTKVMFKQNENGNYCVDSYTQEIDEIDANLLREITLWLKIYSEIIWHI